VCVPDVVDEGKMRAVRSWVGQTDRFVGCHQENVGQMRRETQKSGSSSASLSNGIVKLKALKL
jgi:hypothetical protein